MPTVSSEIAYRQLERRFGELAEGFGELANPETGPKQRLSVYGNRETVPDGIRVVSESF